MKDARIAFEPSFLGGLTAIVLTLVFTFLIVIPSCTLGLPRLPWIATGTILGPTAEDLKVSISPTGYASVGDTPVPPAQLEQAIARELAQHAYHRVLIEADARVRYASLEPVLRAARDHRKPVVFVSRDVSVAEAQP